MPHPACTHPVLDSRDMAGMTAHELLYFTDTPVAHVAAFRDFQRDELIERRREAIARSMARRAH